MSDGAWIPTSSSEEDRSSNNVNYRCRNHKTQEDGGLKKNKGTQNDDANNNSLGINNNTLVEQRSLTTSRTNCGDSNLEPVEVHFCHVFNEGSGESLVEADGFHGPSGYSRPSPLHAFESDSNSVANNRNMSFLEEDVDDMEEELGGEERSETESEFFDCVDAGDALNISNTMRLARGELLQRCTPPPRQSTAPVLNKQKNFVVDYANLRRSGYFLEKQNVLPHKDTPVGLITSNVKITAARCDNVPPMVREWVKNLPQDSQYLEDSEDELMGKHELCEMTRYELWGKYMTDEDHFKNMILEYGDVIKYTSKPAKPISVSNVEKILEVANNAVDEYLEKLHRNERYVEPEYVCGKVAFPAAWESEKETSPKNPSPKKHSWIKHLLPLQTDVGEGNNHCNTELGRQPDEEERFEISQIVLEPYHGPVFVNGAIIEAGCTHPVMSKGMFANIVEEIKAVLQAIHKALRKDEFPAQPPPASPASSFYQTRPICEDPEIQQLTEMLQDRQQKKKSTYRTVFGLRNLEKSPRYNMALNRRLRTVHRQPRQRGNGKFMRAINGWIQRDASRPYYGNRYRFFQHNDDPVQNDPDQRFPRELPPPTRNNFLTSTVAQIVSAMKSIVPFQITPEPSPAIPAFQLDGNMRQNSRILRSTPNSRISGNSSAHACVPVATRYKAMKNNNTSVRRRLRKQRNLDNI